MQNSGLFRSVGYPSASSLSLSLSLATRDLSEKTAAPFPRAHLSPTSRAYVKHARLNRSLFIIALSRASSPSPLSPRPQVISSFDLLTPPVANIFISKVRKSRRRISRFTLASSPPIFPFFFFLPLQPIWTFFYFHAPLSITRGGSLAATRKRISSNKSLPIVRLAAYSHPRAITRGIPRFSASLLHPGLAR